MVAIISRIQIQNFRSIRFVDISDVPEYLPMVGLNSSGKSNVLRALSLFFSGRIDETTAGIELVRDYSGFAPKGKRKEVSVGVELDLGGAINVRGQEEFREAHGLVDKIGLRRTWFIEQGAPSVSSRIEFGPTLDELKQPTDRQEESSVESFIRSVDFRYIPNHVRPVDLMLSQVTPVRRALMQRLQGTREYRDGSPESVMLALGRTASRMFEDVSERVGTGVPGLSMEPQLPQSFADLAFELIISTVAGDAIARSPELEGSGAQSFMLLHFLDLADRTARSQGFGWVQASVWAFEEPESYLHSGLRYKYADDLREYALDTRRQILLTTHSDEFVSVADSTAMVAIGESKQGTSIELLAPRDANRVSAQRAISVYRHPLSQRPDVPLVIVEGPTDKQYIRDAVVQSGIRPRWRVVSGEDLDLKSGGDAILSYIKANEAAVRSRPLSGPVIVLRDWESTDCNKYKRALAIHESSTCIVAPASVTNPELGDKFVGIERFLPTNVVRSGIPGGGLFEPVDGGPLQVDRQALESSKKILVQALRDNGSVGDYLLELVEWIDRQVHRALESVSPEEFV